MQVASFISALHSLDNRVLLFINGMHSPFIDEAMFCISGRFTWIPLYAVLVAFIIYKYKRQSWIMILFAVLAIVLSDQLANLVKNEVMRLRPSHTPGIMEMLHYYWGSDGKPYEGGLYGFVSNHGANSSALTLYVALLLRNKYITGILIVWACLLCYSRMYLGVHFPSDILGGILVGCVSGFICYKGFLLLKQKVTSKT